MTAPVALLIARLTLAVAATRTKSGHVAQRVDHEHRGICSHRACSPSCLETQALLADALDWIDEHWSELEPPAQLRLLEQTG